jgi:hypothetical protein
VGFLAIDSGEGGGERGVKGGRQERFIVLDPGTRSIGED